MSGCGVELLVVVCQEFFFLPHTISNHVLCVTSPGVAARGSKSIRKNMQVAQVGVGRRLAVQVLPSGEQFDRCTTDGRFFERQCEGGGSQCGTSVDLGVRWSDDVSTR